MLMTDFQWQLSYKDGFAIFKGVSPYPEVEKYIAVDWNASSSFLLCETVPYFIPGDGSG